MSTSEKVKALSVAGGAVAALLMSAPFAQADPVLPGPPPPPPGPEQSISTQAAAGDPALPPAPPAEVPHLMSPQNLPPGTSDVPVEPPEGRGTSYLRDLWHAVQTQDISGRDALLLLTQRPMDANAMPTNGMPIAPQAPPGTPQPEATGPAPDAPAIDAPPPGPVLPESAPAPGPLPDPPPASPAP